MFVDVQSFPDSLLNEDNMCHLVTLLPEADLDPEREPRRSGMSHLSTRPRELIKTIRQPIPIPYSSRDLMVPESSLA